MQIHAIAPDAGMNVRCLCGAEFSLVRNLVRHCEAENGAIFEEFAKRPEFTGFGYIGGRGHLSEDDRAKADRAVLEAALRLGVDEERLFAWANSKGGRWFAEAPNARDAASYLTF